MGNLFKYITISVYPLQSNQTASVMLLVLFLLIFFIKLTMLTFSVKQKTEKPENNIFCPPTGTTDKLSIFNSGKETTIQ